MRDLVEDDAPHLGAQTLGIAARDAFERQAVDRDLVRQSACVVGAAPAPRDPLVEAEEGLSRRRLVLDGDGDVRHQAADVVGQLVERVAHELIEFGCAVLAHLSRSYGEAGALAGAPPSPSAPPPRAATAGAGAGAAAA